jgi:hypothetical protein
MTDPTTPTYHDLYITTPTIERTRLFDLPYELYVQCSRVGGWQVWRRPRGQDDELVGGEYDLDDWLVLDVKGHVIVDSRP